MWSHEPLEVQLTCPRCTAPLGRPDTACGRCGQDVALAADGTRFIAVGAVCPRCNRPSRPREAFFSATGWSDAGACPHCGSALDVVAANAAAQIHEEQAVHCAAHDLERLARAEAVDGWALWDTTIDPRDPAAILAHFRRSARNAPPPDAHVVGRPPPGVRGVARPSPQTRGGDPSSGAAPSAVDADASRASSSSRSRLPAPVRVSRPGRMATAAVSRLWPARGLRHPASLGDFAWSMLLGLVLCGIFLAIFVSVGAAVLAFKVLRRGGRFAVAILALVGIMRRKRREKRAARWLRKIGKRRAAGWGAAWDW